jgi:hypothetical protein
MGKRICSFVGVAIIALSLTACSGKPEPAEVVISLDKTVQPLTSASVIVDYSDAAAKLQIAGGEPACFVLPPDMTGDFSDDGAGQLTVDIRARRAFTAPIDLAVCRMIPDSSEIAAATISSRLNVALASATDTKGDKLDDRRLAMIRSGGRDVSTAAPDEAAPPPDDGSAMKVDRGSMGSGVDSGSNSGAAHGGTNTGSGSLGDALRQRNTGNPAKEIEREAERAQREAEQAERAARGGLGSGSTGLNAGGGSAGSDPGEVGDALDGDDDAEAENDPDVGHTTPSYDVTVDILNNAGLIAALQFDINHTGRSGGWQGQGGSVRCDWRISGGLAVCNDVSNGRVRCAYTDLSGFQTPASVITCVFRTDDALSASNFNVQVVDSTGPDFGKASVNMAVTSVVQR